ncbi:MAG: DUF5615 family PIN-like protein [Chloroflexota bacterium]
MLDESADARLLPHLNALGHDVTRLGTDYPLGLPDHRVLAVAHEEYRILITNDTDFGELVFHHRQPHSGVILFRLGSYVPLPIRIARLDDVLHRYSDHLEEFLVVTLQRIRVRGAPLR